jgi:hypothetical protein
MLTGVVRHLVHQSGELATLLESHSIVPKTSPATGEPKPEPTS